MLIAFWFLLENNKLLWLKGTNAFDKAFNYQAVNESKPLGSVQSSCLPRNQMSIYLQDWIKWSHNSWCQLLIYLEVSLCCKSQLFQPFFALSKLVCLWQVKLSQT